MVGSVNLDHSFTVDALPRPGQTVLVLAWLVGLQLMVSGVFRLVASFSASESRALLAVAGVLAIVVGILVLRHPLQTVAVLALLLGLYWAISGAIEIVHADRCNELVGGPDAHLIIDDTATRSCR